MVILGGAQAVEVLHVLVLICVIKCAAQSSGQASVVAMLCGAMSCVLAVACGVQHSGKSVCCGVNM